MTTAAPTVANVKALADAAEPVVKRYLQVRAVAETLGDLIKANQRKILAAGNYRTNPKHMGRRASLPERITNPSDTYLICDEDVVDYYRQCEDYVESLGFEVERGYCPALMADHDRVKLENGLMDLAAHHMNCPEMADCWGDNRKKLIDMVVSLVVSRSTFRNPKPETHYLGVDLRTL